MEIAQTELLEITYLADTETLLCSVKDVGTDVSDDRLRQALGVISATLTTYGSQSVQVKWCWDLQRLPFCITKGSRIAYIERYMKGLAPLISKTVTATAIVFRDTRLSRVFKTLLRLVEQDKPVKVFESDVPKAFLWLRDLQHGKRLRTIA